MAFVTSQQLVATLARETGEQWVTLATVDHDDLSMPLRLASPYSGSLGSNGNTFIGTFFDFQAGSEEFGEPPILRLVVDAVDGSILTALQGLDPSPVVDIELVALSQPDAVQAAWRGFEIISATIAGAQSMTFELGTESFTVLSFPNLSMTRQELPGIFTDL